MRARNTAPREPRPQEHTYTHPLHEQREQTELERALSADDWARARELVEGGASHDVYLHWRESTILIEAARAGKVEMVEWLAGRGVDVNERTSIGTTALSEAVTMEQWDTCFALIRAGADVALADEHGYGHAVLAAARAGRVEVLEEFARLGVDVRLSSRRGFSALAAAARAGHLAVVTFLLERGAPVDGDAAGDSVTPALDAASHGHMEVVRALIERGGSVRAHLSPAFATDATDPEPERTRDPHDPREGAPLLLAARNGRLADVQLLVGQGGLGVDSVDWLGETALIEAARSGQLEMVRWLLERGAAVDAANDRGESPLLVAIGGGHAETVSALLGAGAAVSATNREQMGAAHYAALAGQAAMLADLGARGVPLDAPNARADTPLLLAARRGHAEAVRALLASGADAASAGARGNGAVIGAVRAGSEEALRALLDANAPADMPNAKGETALHEAARLGHASLARMLIDALGGERSAKLAAALEARTKFEDTPLLLAATHGQDELVRLLVAAGADRAVVDRSGASVDELLERVRSSRAADDQLDGGDAS